MIPPSGEQHERVFGDQRAVVVEVGGGLRTYGDVLDGYGVDEMCSSGRGQVLAPWPNRIEDERDADGRWRLHAGDVTVWADEAWPYVQVFTGDPLPDVARRSLAVEPMTCAPQPFRTGEGLTRLEPGGRFDGMWGIQPARGPHA